MNNLILNKDVQAFINENLGADVSALALKGSPFEGVETRELLEQIGAKKRCKNKLPTWFNAEGIYYPNKVNIEQTSSEITAKYKSELVTGKSLIDLTGGFGVDALYFSKRIENVLHCEINEGLSAIVKHNYKQLNVNVETVAEDGIHHLKNTQKQYDWIYIDPSRRHKHKGKVFFLKDCLPNVPEHLGELFQHANHILIKTAPLLDISAGLEELKHVKAIHCVAVNNEMKELLWVLENEFSGSINVTTVNLKSTSSLSAMKHKSGRQEFSFVLSEEPTAKASFGLPLSYLYEPNPAVMKSGAFQSVSAQFQVLKLHQNTRLYTSETLVENFVGRVFSIEKTLPYNKKELTVFKNTKANVATRHFPESVASIRKKFKIKDGGNTYLFFTTVEDGNKAVLVCKKL